MFKTAPLQAIYQSIRSSLPPPLPSSPSYRHQAVPLPALSVTIAFYTQRGSPGKPQETKS